MKFGSDLTIAVSVSPHIFPPRIRGAGEQRSTLYDPHGVPMRDLLPVPTASTSRRSVHCPDQVRLAGMPGKEFLARVRAREER